MSKLVMIKIFHHRKILSFYFWFNCIRFSWRKLFQPYKVDKKSVLIFLDLDVCHCQYTLSSYKMNYFVSEPEFSLSPRGNLVVQIGKWRFHKHASWGSKVRWTCTKKKMGCTAAITTRDNFIVKTIGNHNHWRKKFCYTRYESRFASKYLGIEI